MLFNYCCYILFLVYSKILSVCIWFVFFFFFKQKTAYEMRISDWSSDVCSSDLEWEEADVVLAGVSRSSKTPTSIYLANRGYKVANIPLIPESPPPDVLFRLKNPLIVGLTTSPDRLVQVRRNRLLALKQAPETAYVDPGVVAAEVAFARRLFADNGWPVIDVTRRSIEETAAAVMNLLLDRREDQEQAA